MNDSKCCVRKILILQILYLHFYIFKILMKTPVNYEKNTIVIRRVGPLFRLNTKKYA